MENRKNLYMLPETEATRFVSGTGHIVDIPDPAFPNSAHLSSINRTLALLGICGVRRLPFTGLAGLGRAGF